jgi:midasin
VLLEGPAGCGKSAVLEEVAHITGNGDFVTLHLDAQTDSKSLLGAYVCGAAPGEFKWQPGALTQAVTRGVWVLIEDIDLAPFEVLSALVPLLEKRKLYVPGRGESIPAAPGFQLFGSVTTEAGRSTSSADPLSGLWTRVVVEPPQGDEATAILCGLYPNLAQLAKPMLSTVRQVQGLCGQGGSTAGEAAGLGPLSSQDVSITDATSSAMDAMDVERVASGLEAQASDVNHSLTRVYAGRPFTLRDILRWARRIAMLRPHELALLRPDKAAPPQLRRAAYDEAADVLAGMLPAGPGRRRVLKMIAATWGLPAEDTAEATDRLHKPSIREAHQSVTIGRCLLPVGDTKVQGAKWSRTGHASRLLERVAAAVQLSEPALLVGETGTGKTALIQELARLTGAPLTVVNLSNQSESADFLGGFKPVSARHLCLPLLPKFHNAFNRTFPSSSNAEFLTRIARYAEKRKWAHLLHAFRAGVERVAKLAAEAAKESGTRETDETEG